MHETHEAETAHNTKTAVRLLAASLGVQILVLLVILFCCMCHGEGDQHGRVDQAGSQIGSPGGGAGDRGIGQPVAPGTPDPTPRLDRATAGVQDPDPARPSRIPLSRDAEPTTSLRLGPETDRDLTGAAIATTGGDIAGGGFSGGPGGFGQGLDGQDGVGAGIGILIGVAVVGAGVACAVEWCRDNGRDGTVTPFGPGPNIPEPGAAALYALGIFLVARRAKPLVEAAL